MAKQKITKRTITDPITDKIQRLNKLLVTDRNNPEVKKLQSEIDYFNYGII
jgi:hypothetical protein